MKDGKDDIDSSGELPGGIKVDGAVALRKLLKDKYQDRFVRCLIEKTLTYGIGRGLDYYDLCTVEKIEKQLPAANYRFSTMIFEIVRSDAFQKIGERE